MKRTVLFLSILLALAYAAPKVGAISNIGGWLGHPSLSPSPGNAAAYARSGFLAPWVVAVEAGGTVYSSYADPTGSDTWHAWLASTPPAGTFGSQQPALTYLPSGRYLVVILGGDQQLWAQEQDQHGVVFTAWHVIQAGAVFSEGPSIALNKTPLVGQMVPTLMIVARGTDDHIYTSRNLMTFPLNSYHANHWESLVVVSTHGFTSRPAIVDKCNETTSTGGHSFIVAALNNDDFPGQFQYWRYDGSAFDVVPFAVFNGTFVQGPALACAGSGSSAEISIWGTGGAPYQLWDSTQISGGPGGFALFGNSALDQNLRPTARASGNALMVGAWTAVQARPFYAHATSP